MEYLLWLPPAYRKVKFTPTSCLTLIGTGTVEIDRSHFLHGNMWWQCYNMDSTNIKVYPYSTVSQNSKTKGKKQGKKRKERDWEDTLRPPYHE